MALYNPENTPEDNLATLAGNSYPGRLLVVGFYDDAAVQAYAITGRSEGSQNRIFVDQDAIVSTEVHDPELEKGDPALTIYDAMRCVDDVHIVSNGNQTDTVARYLRSRGTFEDAMAVTEHEPDGPIFTPRITGFLDEGAIDDDRAYMGISVIARDPETGESVRKLYTDLDGLDVPDDVEGIGYAVHTYQGDPGNGTPPLSFDEPPFRVPVTDVAEDMAEMLWDNLNADNRVSVAARVVVDEHVFIATINRHDPQTLPLTTRRYFRFPETRSIR